MIWFILLGMMPIDARSAWSNSATHWAFLAPHRPDLPKPGQNDWPINAIDHFILARLEASGVAPSPPADRATLLRRVCLDLTGLPPALEELEAFLRDPRPDAYERWVDRLLASPHYGERWGRHWLDVARYADSNGYSIDAPRTIWPYRDWVVKALNDDLPFDRFVIEQLAGDLLPDATDDQKIATGFHRNTQINQEGGIDPEQFRVESIIDRVNTTGTAFLGLTVACAQCHDHKFDPITQRDYYQLFAFFNDQDEPALEVPHHRNGNGKAVQTMILRERSQPRETRLLIKGDFTRPGEPVEPGLPAVLKSSGSQTSTRRLNRLDLAQWLVDPANPLTARVTVNRQWQHYFGRGLVETENDFGTQGSAPTHPELLDWLALELIARQWSLKAMHRLIVTSATYRQSSKARPDLAAQDPNNKLLARQSRLRLDAEIIRDQALASSGVLSRTVGGPPVFPPQPDGVMSLGQANNRAWKPSEGVDRYRRGLYTFFWRATPHPALSVFDAPDAFSACTRRLRSNTPLQALTLLNDQQYYELAQALTRRMIGEGPAENEARLAYGFRLCLARDPSRHELSRLGELLTPPAGAAEGSALAGSIEPWLTVARVLMNLDETMTRE